MARSPHHPTSDGGFLLTCDGVSDLVRGKSALFLSELEDAIEILDPANTVFVADTSRTYNDALLYLESHRRRSTPNDELIHLVACYFREWESGRPIDSRAVVPRRHRCR